MQQIILTKGLPAAGKSSWAKEKVSQDGTFIRVNKDELRSTLFCGQRWTQAKEGLVIMTRDYIVGQAILSGKSVIVDDTNFAPKHFNAMEGIGIKYRKEGRDIRVAYQDFTHVPVETCIERDLKREHSVGQKVIMDMYNKYLRPAPEKIPYLPHLEDCIIVDIDGTIAKMCDRSPYDTSCRVFDDEVHAPIIQIAKRSGYRPIFVSGRESTDECRKATVRWLTEKAGFEHPLLIMRNFGDHRPDYVVKKEIFDNHIRNKYNVIFVLDDRNQVVDMWRNKLGLYCLQVADGNF